MVQQEFCVAILDHYLRIKLDFLDGELEGKHAGILVEASPIELFTIDSQVISEAPIKLTVADPTPIDPALVTDSISIDSALNVPLTIDHVLVRARSSSIAADPIGEAGIETFCIFVFLFLSL